MKTLLNGQASTLGNYRQLTELYLGEHSKAVQFLDEKIAAAPAGAQEEVLAEESQMLAMLSDLGRTR